MNRYDIEELAEEICDAVYLAQNPKGIDIVKLNHTIIDIIEGSVDVNNDDAEMDYDE